MLSQEIEKSMLILMKMLVNLTNAKISADYADHANPSEGGQC